MDESSIQTNTPAARRPPRGRTKKVREVKESTIEKYFLTSVRAAGALVMKFVSPGNVGVPDRLVIHEGHHVFVELKRPGEKPRTSQEYRMEQMRRHGAECLVVDTKKGVDEFVADLLNRTRNS